MIRRIAITALLALSLAPLSVSANDAHCETWAADYSYPRDSYRMRQLGCNDEAVPGLYEATPGICNRLARQAGRAGYRGNDARLYVEGHNESCYWDVEARNYGVASTTMKAR